MDPSTSIFLLYVSVMLIFAFMLRSLLPSPHYYGILIMVGILVFILMYPVPNIYSAAQYSIVQRPIRDRIDELVWENEPNPEVVAEKVPEPKMPVAPKPIVIKTK
jgi:hypothetical protein